MYWHIVAAEREAGVIDESREIVGSELDRKRRMQFFRDLMRRHRESRAVWGVKRYGVPVSRE